jgi:hypothetical protein
MCQPETQTDAILRHSREAAMTNVSATRQVWLCPIARDDAVNPLMRAELVSTPSVSCTLYLRTKDADLVDADSRLDHLTHWGANNPSYLVQVWGPLSSAKKGENGFYAFQCFVPPGEQVASYLIYESPTREPPLVVVE